MLAVPGMAGAPLPIMRIVPIAGIVGLGIVAIVHIMGVLPIASADTCGSPALQGPGPPAMARPWPARLVVASTGRFGPFPGGSPLAEIFFRIFSGISAGIFSGIFSVAIPVTTVWMVAPSIFAGTGNVAIIAA